MARAPSGDFDGLGAAGDFAQFALGAVGHADSSLDDAVGAVGEGAFAADSAGGGFFVRGAAVVVARRAAGAGAAAAATASTGFFKFGGGLFAGGFRGRAGAGFALGGHGVGEMEETIY